MQCRIFFAKAEKVDSVIEICQKMLQKTRDEEQVSPPLKIFVVNRFISAWAHIATIEGFKKLSALTISLLPAAKKFYSGIKLVAFENRTVLVGLTKVSCF